MTRPNARKLFKITLHTVQLLGNGRMIYEMVLEFVHFLKKWLEDHRNVDSQITFVDIELF